MFLRRSHHSRRAGTVVDKPLYWTSFDLVNKVRIIIRSTLGIRKIK